MEEQTKEYIRYLLAKIKSLYGENLALKTLNRQSPFPQIREQWETVLDELMADPNSKRELDAKFDPHFEQILQSLSDSEAFSVLLRLPTKGLPN